ncbi:MAG: inositol monophosphatase family protein [Saprospiraceae bacterium]
MELQLKEILVEVEKIAKKAGGYLLSEFGKVNTAQIEEKSLNSLVSYVDKTAEIQIVSALSALIPGSVFLTEEATIETSTGEYRWVIDPLDGTTNFLFNIPVFSVSIGLEYKGKGVLGVIYDPNRNECFSACKGNGATLNGHEIHVSKKTRLADTLLATGFPYHDYGMLDAYLNTMGILMSSCRGLRRIGSAAIDLAYVAAGRFDAFWEYHLQPWDISAGLVIVEEAGGQISDFYGIPDALTGKSLIASNKLVHRELQDIIGRQFII